VVGVDGSPSSLAALEWAAAQAQLRGAQLEIVHAAFYRQVMLEALAPDMLDTEQSVLDRAIARARAVAPGTVVTGRICDPRPGQALVAASEGAEMLVVGSRGLTGLKKLALDSASSECLRSALCPVVVVCPAAWHPVAGKEEGRNGDSTQVAVSTAEAAEEKTRLAEAGPGK
jgi:nucleotide-binding universal stress UspA family protein